MGDVIIHLEDHISKEGSSRGSLALLKITGVWRPLLGHH